MTCTEATWFPCWVRASLQWHLDLSSPLRGPGFPQANPYNHSGIKGRKKERYGLLDVEWGWNLLSGVCKSQVGGTLALEGESQSVEFERKIFLTVLWLARWRNGPGRLTFIFLSEYTKKGPRSRYSFTQGTLEGWR